MASNAERNRRRRIPIFVGTDHPLFDHTTHPHKDAWQPGNRQTALLFVCMEACRNLIYLAGRLDQADPGKDRVGLTLMATPLAILVEEVMKLQSELRKTGAGTSRMSPQDVENTKLFGSRVNVHTRPPRLLWKIRNERSSHLDPDFAREEVAPPATLELILPILGDAIMLLALCARHDGFTWFRSPKPGNTRVWEKLVPVPGTSRNLAVPFEVDENNHIVGLGDLSLVQDPVLLFSPILQGMEDMFNRLAAIRRAGPEPEVTA